MNSDHPKIPGSTGRILIYAIHRTHDWWRHIGASMGFAACIVLTDRRGEGDAWVTDDFYEAYRKYHRLNSRSSDLLDAEEVSDAIARCRVLRWLPVRKASAMVLGMADAMQTKLEALKPEAVVSFPIDNYITDVLARLSRKRDVPYFELTASALPGMCMLMHRGRLITRQALPDQDLLGRKIREIADPLFAPSYVQGQAAYTPLRFLKTLTYFRIRAAYFKLYSWYRRDPLNIHYMDAQPGLGHKPRYGDVRITTLFDQDWRERLSGFPREKRVLFGLQLFPEAAIDYWIDNLELIQHENLVVDVAKQFSAAGYQIMVKDHPLQFGFRQTGLIDRLKALENTVIVPYEVSGNELLQAAGINFTCTGTLGLQAALLGLKSVVTPGYYTNTHDFILLTSAEKIPDLVLQAKSTPSPSDLAERQSRIVSWLLQGSFEADFFSFKDFRPENPAPAVAILGKALGDHIRALGPDGEAWHRIALPTGSGDHSGSPLS